MRFNLGISENGYRCSTEYQSDLVVCRPVPAPLRRSHPAAQGLNSVRRYPSTPGVLIDSTRGPYLVISGGGLHRKPTNALLFHASVPGDNGVGVLIRDPA